MRLEACFSSRMGQTDRDSYEKIVDEMRFELDMLSGSVSVADAAESWEYLRQKRRG